MKLCIIIPAYNEEKRIGRTLDAFSVYFNGLLNMRKINDYEILVVINGTKDKTEDVVKEKQKKNRKIEYINFKKGGKGFAITEGFRLSLKEDFDNVGFVDADLATTPEEYWKLISNMGNYDGSIANRYLKGSKITPPHSFRRLFVSRVYNFIVRALFLLPYSDTQCGAKVFRKKVIERIFDELLLTNWAYDVNILHLCKKHGFKIKEVPTDWIEIGGGHLNVNRASIQMLFAITQLRILKSQFKGALRVISPVIDFIYHKVLLFTLH